MQERQRPHLMLVFQPLQASYSRNTTSHGPGKVIGLIFEGILHFAGWSSGWNPTLNSLPKYKRMGLSTKDLAVIFPLGFSYACFSLESIKGSRFIKDTSGYVKTHIACPAGKDNKGQ
ncbi:MAG: hypothetical protein K0S39_801 [Paenibacillus sp.]|nr:hypothetical protein [Paenibacillus sp.]